MKENKEHFENPGDDDFDVTSIDSLTDKLSEIERKIDDKKPISKEEVGFIYGLKYTVPDSVVIGNSGSGELVKHMSRVLLKRKPEEKQDYAIFFDCKESEVAVTFDDIHDNTIIAMCNFEGPKLIKMKSMPKKLKYVLGARFNNSPIKDLGVLEIIAHGAYFTYSKIKDLTPLTKIGSNAYFSQSDTESLGSLRYIGGDAYFEKSKVQDLGALVFVGGDVLVDKNSKLDFSNIEIEGKIIEK